MRECLVAFDRIGQNVSRPFHWHHWTHGALAGHISEPPYELLNCVPAGYRHSNFTSHLLSIDHRANYIADFLFNEYLEASMDDQKQFLVESLLVPGLYEHNPVGIKARSWCNHLYQRHLQQDPLLSILKVLRSGIDVNRPIQRSGRHSNYSIWQFFLMYLFSFIHRAEIIYSRPGERIFRRLDCGIMVKIFRALIEAGANPFTVITNKNLDPNSLETVGRAAFPLSGADIVADLEIVCR